MSSINNFVSPLAVLESIYTERYRVNCKTKQHAPPFIQKPFVQSQIYHAAFTDERTILRKNIRILDTTYSIS